MRNPYIYSAILKGKWAIEPGLMNSLQPVITGLFDKNMMTSFDEDKPELNINLIAIDGTRLTINATGPNKEGSMFDSAPKGSVAVVPIKGVMFKEDTMCDYGTSTLSSIMLEAVAHENISALLLNIDSGGGAVDSIAPLSFAIAKAKAANMPVVVLSDMAASAAYYVASFADHIMADNNISSEFGSIGVMVSFQDAQPYYEKMGVKFHTIYASESTHKNKAFELALQGKYEQMKSEILSPLAKDFMSTVRANRNGKINLTVPGILNGKMFYAEKAMEYGLIDSIGNIDKALELIHQMSN